MRPLIALCIATWAAIAGTSHATAQTLVIGAATSNNTLDPLFNDNQPNLQAASHLFDRLIDQDDQLRLRPGLATAWRAINDTTWDFTLREGVRFHDGSPFAAPDVVASINRANAVENSPASFTVYTRPIERVEVLGPHQVRFHTVGPFPLLPNYLAMVNIVPRDHERTPTAEFNAGRAVVGTGPFKLIAWVPGERLEVERNPTWWGGAVAWERVIFRFIPNDAARVAALLSRQVDIVDAVPTTVAGALAGRPDIAVHRAAAARLISLALDSARARTPFVTGSGGEPIDNPLRDRRVRQALAMAINPVAIVERIHSGQALAATQLVREGFGGFDPDLTPTRYDPDEARRLLAAAGYPNGFALTIHGPSNRYPNDEQTLQAIGAMFTRIGLRVQVETPAYQIFLTRFARLEYSIALQGFTTITGESSSILRGLLATYDRELGNGTSNRGRYSNPEFDRLLGLALTAMDDAERERLLRQATQVAMADAALIPLYFQLNTWASRSGLTYIARADDQTRAVYVRRSD